MTTNLSTLITEYNEAAANLATMKSRVASEYEKLQPLEQFKLVIDLGADFLGREIYYCPHLTLADGTEVSLYDDLYWEKYETKNIMELIEGAYEDFTGKWVTRAELCDALQSCYVEVFNQDTAKAAVLRDMIQQGIGSGKHDW